MLQAASTVDGIVLWANLHLLFWLSLFPFVTAWMGQNPFAPVPTAAYGVVFLLAAIAYYVLSRALIACPGQTPALAAAVGTDRKAVVSTLAYVVAIVASPAAPPVAVGPYVAVAVVWFVPDRRIEGRMVR